MQVQIGITVDEMDKRLGHKGYLLEQVAGGGNAIEGIQLPAGANIYHWADPKNYVTAYVMDGKIIATGYVPLGSVFPNQNYAYLTQSKMDQLIKGKTSYQEAAEIVGSPGLNIARSSYKGISISTFSWSDKDDSTVRFITLSFENGMLSSKEVFGELPAGEVPKVE